MNVSIGISALLLSVLLAPVSRGQDAVSECDRRAAYPDDPNRTAPGVAREAIDLPVTIAVCEQAVAAAPGNFRVRYQLARVLFYAGQNERAVETMREAADGGYAQAQFVFGTFIDRARAGAPTDICLAEQYWRKAAAGGRQAARVAYVRHTLRGRFKSCANVAAPDEMVDMLAIAAETATNYYERLLIEDLAAELADYAPTPSANASPPAGTRTTEFACRKGTDVAALDGIRTRRFGETAAMTTQLNALILSGEKTITATSPWLYEQDASLKPIAGSYTIVLDADGVAQAVIRSTEVKTVPFSAVTANDSRYEGTAVRPIDEWRKVHTSYFNRVLSPLGKSWAADMPVTLERFEVVCRAR
ncbi:MAG: ASCH domain-containing protein [Steroidobacteraceae bacterium]